MNVRLNLARCFKLLNCLGSTTTFVLLHLYRQISIKRASAMKLYSFWTCLTSFSASDGIELE